MIRTLPFCSFSLNIIITCIHIYFQTMSSNDSTINLDDSSVLSSTKNSSVLEVTNDSVINISSDSSDTEGEDEDDTTVNSTSENVDSSSERMLRENSKELSTTEFNSDEELGGEGEVKGKTDAVDDADAALLVCQVNPALLSKPCCLYNFDVDRPIEKYEQAHRDQPRRQQAEPVYVVVDVRRIPSELRNFVMN